MEQSAYRKWRFKWRGLLQHLPSVRVDDKRKWFVGELQKPVAQGSAHIITDIDANAVTFVERKRAPKPVLNVKVLSVRRWRLSDSSSVSGNVAVAVLWDSEFTVPPTPTVR